MMGEGDRICGMKRIGGESRIYRMKGSERESRICRIEGLEKKVKQNESHPSISANPALPLRLHPRNQLTPLESAIAKHDQHRVDDPQRPGPAATPASR